MKFTCHVDIDIPRDQVITLFDEPDNMRHWQDGFVSFERLSGDIGEVGAKAKVTYDNKGKDMVLIETLTVYNLPHELSGTYEHEVMTNDMQNLFEEIGPNKTRWIANIHYTRMNGMIKIISWIVPGLFKKQVQKWMDQFKVFAESRAV